MGDVFERQGPRLPIFGFLWWGVGAVLFAQKDNSSNRCRLHQHFLVLLGAVSAIEAVAKTLTFRECGKKVMAFAAASIQGT
jgi:hypothetical protein